LVCELQNITKRVRFQKLLADSFERMQDPPVDFREVGENIKKIIEEDEATSSLGKVYRATTAKDVSKYEDPEFLIDEVLVKGNIHVLGGYAGMFKSVVASPSSGLS